MRLCCHGNEGPHNAPFPGAEHKGGFVSVYVFLQMPSIFVKTSSHSSYNKYTTPEQGQMQHRGPSSAYLCACGGGGN